MRRVDFVCQILVKKVTMTIIIMMMVNIMIPLKMMVHR